MLALKNKSGIFLAKEEKVLKQVLENKTKRSKGKVCVEPGWLKP